MAIKGVPSFSILTQNPFLGGSCRGDSSSHRAEGLFASFCPPEHGLTQLHPHYWCTGQMEEAAETPWKGHDPWSTNKGKSLGPKLHTQIVKLMTDFFTECEAPRSSHWAEHCLCKHFQSAFIPIWERKCSGKLVRMDSHEVSNNTHVLLKSEIPQVKLWARSFLILSQTRQHQGMWTHWRENLTKLFPSFYVCQKIHPSSRKVSSL